MDVNESPRILITRLSHIGDCVLTIPLLAAVRKKYPQAYIAWAAESPTHKLLKLHQGIDELIVIPKSWMSKPKHWFELSKQLKSHRFDVAIDPQGITKSAMLARLSGAKKRIGIRGRWGRELSPYLNNRLVTTNEPHIVDRSMELLSELDINPSAVRAEGLDLNLPLCSESHAAVKSQLAKLLPDPRFVMINPGGSWASKRWEMDRFGSVASYLKRHHGLTSLIVWAGEEEKMMADQIYNFDTSASVIASQTNLLELAAMASEAEFFVGSDTGPLHIASAVGTPCVGLYGTTQPEESGAYGPQHIAIQKWYQSGSCRKRRGADNDAMRDIMASDVFTACDQMIAKLRARNAA